MATPDIQNLFDRFLQIYGGQSSPTESAPSELRSQSSQPAYTAPRDTYEADGGKSPTGGVLRGLNSSSAIPWWAQALARPGGIAVGPRGPLPVGRFRGFGFPLVPSDPVEIPSPHLERVIPQPARDIWNAATLLRGMLRDRLAGDEPSNGRIEEQNGVTSSEPPRESPANRPGSQPPWYAGPPVSDEERKRQSASDESERRSARQLDPDFRKLARVDSAKDYAAVALPQATGRKVPRIASPPVVPEAEEPESKFEREGVTGGGNCGNGRDDEGQEPDKNGYCDARQDTEIERCDLRSQKRPRWPNFLACVARARTRGDLCRRNGGLPPLMEREEWGIDDEHQINSDKRFMKRQERQTNVPKGSRKYRK